MPKITQDIDGKIIGSELSSEEASELAHKRWAKHGSESLERLISQAGYSSVAECPEHLRVLGKLAVSSRSGAVAAMRAFLQLTGRGSQDTPEVVPACENCQWDMRQWLDAAGIERIKAAIAEHRAVLAEGGK